MLRLGLLGIAILAILQIGGIGCSKGVADRPKDTLNLYFSHVATGGFESASETYSETAFTNISKAQFVERLRSGHSQYGNFKSFRVVGFHAESVSGAGARDGTVMQIICVVDYANRTNEETFFLRQKDNRGYEIIAHEVKGLVGPP